MGQQRSRPRSGSLGSGSTGSGSGSGAAGASTGLTSLQFASLARALSEGLQGHGVAVPSFRCPPRSPHLDRSLCRHNDGSVTVAVRLRNRPGVAVVADMIDGAIAALGFEKTHAGRLRDELWARAVGVMSSWSDPLIVAA